MIFLYRAVAEGLEERSSASLSCLEIRYCIYEMLNLRGRTLGRHTLLAPNAVILAILLTHAASAILSAPDELPRGQIIDKVVCLSDPNQSYALYLPSRNAPGQAWPILFCFDPAARGRVSVELFRDAAEQYGYILAGSNNSRNGAAGQGPGSMRAMWNDAQARFIIDPARVFAAGMSGGARLACGFAQGGSFLSGVIAFAAAFPNAQTPKRAPFLFFGAAGTDDFNYPEMRQLDGELEKLGATKRIVTFEGGHGWPPASVCTQGIEWLELQSIKAGKRPRDNDLIEAFFDKAVASIRSAEASGNIGQIYLLTKAVADDFKGLKDVSTYENRAAQLAVSKEVKKYLQDEKNQRAIQYSRATELLAHWKEGYEGEDSAASISFASMLKELKRQSEAPSDSSRRRIARRILHGSYVHAYEQSRSLLEQKDYPAAARMLEMAVSIYPDRPQVLYTLASIYAKAKDRKGALDALKRASEHGFRDAAALEGNDSFDFLRADPGMKKILEEIGKKQ